jgi:hypothetical protein
MELQHSDTDDGTEDETEPVEFSNVMQEHLPRPDADTTVGVIKAELHATHTEPGQIGFDYQVDLTAALHKLITTMADADDWDSILVDLTHGELTAIESAYGNQAGDDEMRLESKRQLPDHREKFYN